MTTNKPKIVAWLRNERGEHARGPATFDPMCISGSPEPQGLAASYSPVVMFSDYEALQAECEKLRKDAGTERQIQRAAQHLPEGWRIIVEVERDAGWIDAFNPDGRRIEIDWVGSLAEQIEQAIDAAMEGDKP